MAVNSSRSQRQSILEGMTDGSYRKVRPNTEVSPGTGDEWMRQARGHLHPPMNYDLITQEVPLPQRALPA